MRILVVDDEKNLAKGIKFNLEHEGYIVECAEDGEEAVEKANTTPFDLIIMDLMMPKMDGLEACRKIREFSGVPIIMLTAKSEDSDKILGFEHGADDYLTKPFNILELKARIRAISRRSASNASVQEEELEIEHLVLNTAQRSVKVDGKTLVELTAKEFDVMELLVRNRGRVYSRDSLLDLIWGYDYPGDIRTVDVHVRRLREKLERDPASPSVLLTKWGVGYYCKV